MHAHVGMLESFARFDINLLTRESQAGAARLYQIDNVLPQTGFSVKIIKGG